VDSLLGDYSWIKERQMAAAAERVGGNIKFWS